MRKEKRKINKFKVGIVVFIFFIFLLTTSGLGRFVYNVIRDKYLTSKEFYFESNLLKSNGEEYTYKNWDGTGIYNFEVELLSKINDLQKLEDDQEYTLMVDFPQGVNCAINDPDGFVDPEHYTYKDDEGVEHEIPPMELEVEKPISKPNTIYLTNDNKDTAIIYVKAISEKITFEQGYKIPITVTAYTSSPYRKSLTAKFIIEISTSYTIEDSEYSKYALLTVRNTSNLNQYFTVNINDNFMLDMNDDAWIHQSSHDTYGYYQYQSYVDTYRVNKITFKVPPETSQQIKLYKKNISAAYTIYNSGLSVTKKISY